MIPSRREGAGRQVALGACWVAGTGAPTSRAAAPSWVSSALMPVAALSPTEGLLVADDRGSPGVLCVQRLMVPATGRQGG